MAWTTRRSRPGWPSCSAPNPFLATVGLRVGPAPAGSGLRFELETELGSLPLAFRTAIEETVHATLRQGLHGWQVTDCVVMLTRSGYWPRQSHAHGTFDKSMSSTAGDFRNLTPLVLMTALRQAGTSVQEPVNRFRLEIPAELAGSVLPVLARLRAIARTVQTRVPLGIVDGHIPVARVRELEQQLPALTRGEGVLECAFSHYQEVRGAIPERPRLDHDPLSRKEYLLRVARGVTGS
jgi:ribosomal protection tetracycline resistance protein